MGFKVSGQTSGSPFPNATPFHVSPRLGGHCLHLVIGRDLPRGRQGGWLCGWLETVAQERFGCLDSHNLVTTDRKGCHSQ